MIIQISSAKINYEHFNQFDPVKKTMILLHGFTGSLEDWRSVSSSLNMSFNYIGIDLIGHGKSESPEEVEKYTTPEIIKQINDVLSHLSLNKIILLGYSMGGRTALNFAVKYPKKVEALILESTSPGIKDEKERETRIKKDEKLAKYIETHKIEEFAEFWINQDIFNTQRRFSDEKRRQIKLAKKKNDKTGLANSVREFGTGKMLPLFDHLQYINCKTLLITGELDEKFTGINKEMVKSFPHAEHKIIDNAGHNTHLEEHGKFAKHINEFLSDI